VAPAPSASVTADAAVDGCTSDVGLLHRRRSPEGNDEDNCDQLVEERSKPSRSPAPDLHLVINQDVNRHWPILAHDAAKPLVDRTAQDANKDESQLDAEQIVHLGRCRMLKPAVWRKSLTYSIAHQMYDAFAEGYSPSLDGGVLLSVKPTTLTCAVAPLQAWIETSCQAVVTDRLDVALDPSRENG
jgi:hypothetical protein